MSERRFPWRTTMFVSLGINLLLVGLIVGALAAGARLRREASGSTLSRAEFTQIIEAMPDDTRRVVRRAVVRGWFQSRDVRREAGRLRREAFEAASAEPYDVERVRAAFARMREADAATTGVYHDRIAEALATLTPEQRRAALEVIRDAARARRSSAIQPDEAAPTPDPEVLDAPTP
jgi:uncharacterized membrane protein